MKSKLYSLSALLAAFALAMLAAAQGVFAAIGISFSVQAGNALEAGIWQTIASKTGAAVWTMEPGVSVTDNPATGAVIVNDSEVIGGPAKRFLRLHVERTTD
jgi:hypothetical protein